MTMVVLLFFVPVLVRILLGLNVLFAVHRPDTEKVTPYECGFNPIYGQVRAPFAIQYYLVGILFLIFDLEIAVLYPLAVTLYQVSVYGFWVAMIFLVLLTVGFVFEYQKGSLNFTDHRSSIHRTPIKSLSKGRRFYSTKSIAGREVKDVQLSTKQIVPSLQFTIPVLSTTILGGSSLSDQEKS